MNSQNLKENINNLRPQTPYMINKKGEILECGSIHPYILYNVKNDFRINLIDFINNSQWLDWFVKNSKQDLNYLINDCLQCIADVFVNDAEIDIFWNFGFNKDDLFIWEPLFKKYNITPKKLNFLIDTNYVATCKAMWGDLNSKYNNEFLRMRTSNLYKYGTGNGIYFRISSFEFNWFNIIWEICAKYKNQISAITIVADRQAGKTIGTGTDYYVLGGKTVDNLPLEEFLTLPGNPVVEHWDNDYEVKIHKGYELNEALSDFGSFHNENIYEAYRQLYFKGNFIGKKLKTAQQRLIEAVIKEVLENPESEEKLPLTLYELLREIGIDKTGTYSDNDTYTIDLTDSNEYGRINSLLDRSDILDPIDESSYVTADNANLDYKYQDQFILSLIADFEEDYYQLVITEMEE